MSSLPSKEGVDKLRKLAFKHRKLEKQLIEIESQIKLRSKLTAEYEEVKTAIRKQLEDMDCASSGNYGYEGRMSWMLAEFACQGNEE